MRKCEPQPKLEVSLDLLYSIDICHLPEERVHRSSLKSNFHKMSTYKMAVKFNEDSSSCSSSSGRTLSSRDLPLKTPRRKTESSNILLKPNFATPKQKNLDNLPGNKRTRSYSLRFQKEHNIGILSGFQNINEILKQDLTTKEARVYLSKILTLPRSEQDIWVSMLQCLAKIVFTKKPSDCMEYLVSRVCKFLKYSKLYVLRYDMSNDKLKQMNDQSCIDLHLTEKE